MSEPMLRNAVKKIPAHSFAGVCADPADVPGIERAGDEEDADTGAFLAVQWKVK